MRTLIYNARAVLEGKVLEDAAIFVDGGVIKSIWRMRKAFSACAKGCLRIDARGNFVSAGFIDTHVHGLPEKIFRNEARFGTTAIFPTLSCAPQKALEDSINRIKRFVRENPLGKNVLGLRIEGPFINPVKAGAQEKRYIVKPDAGRLEAILRVAHGLLKIMTIAPEINGALQIIKKLKQRGVVASVGHSNATYDEAVKGIEAGISHATHTFNAMSWLESRSPGVVGAVLDKSDIKAEVILDLVHIHAALFRLLVRTKGVDNVILATDSVAGDIPRGARVSKGAYRFRDGRIAGSNLTMNRAIANAVDAGGLSMLEAVRLATINPARALGLDKTKGVLDIGRDADIVIFNRLFGVKLTMIRGEVAYLTKGACIGIAKAKYVRNSRLRRE